MTSQARSFPLLLGTETLLLTAFALILSWSPLFRSLSYEFSTLLGAFASLTLAIGISLRLRDLRNQRPFEMKDFTTAGIASLLALIAPLAAMLLVGGASRTCRYDVGAAWFWTETAVSALFGAACAIWANRRPTTKGRVVWLSLLPMILFSVLTLRDLWIDPPLYFFHPAFGYFAGPLYDEWIPLTIPLFTFRLWTLLFSLWLASATVFRTKDRPLFRSVIWWIVGLGVAAPLLFRSQLDWFHSAGDIQTRLGAALKTENVRLFFDPAGLPLPDARRLAKVLDYRVRQVAQRLDVALSPENPVEVYVYPDADQKQRLTGTRYTLIGNPWQRRLHLLDIDPSSPMLTHELTHVVAAPLGMPLLGLPLRAGLLEGLATALEGYSDDLSVHEWAAGMKKLNLLPDVSLVMGTTGFLNQSPSRAYLAAGSFCLWLLDSDGPVPFARVYGGATFRKAYGVNLAELAARWRKFLDSIPLSFTQLNAMQSRLMQRPIFERRCPHDVADERHSAMQCFKRDDRKGALWHATRAWEWGSKAPELALWPAQLHLRASESREAEELLSGVLAASSATPEESSRAFLLLGDLAISKGADREAQTKWSSVRGDLLSNERLAATARLSLLALNEKELLTHLIHSGPDPDWLLALQTRLPKIRTQGALLLYAADAASHQRRPELAQKLLTAIGEQADPKLELKRLLLDAGVAEKLNDVPRAFRDYRAVFLRADSTGLRLKAVDQINRLMATR